MHGRFYLDALPLGIGLVGPGLIGGTFLEQIHEQARYGRRVLGQSFAFRFLAFPFLPSFSESFLHPRFSSTFFYLLPPNPPL